MLIALSSSATLVKFVRQDFPYTNVYLYLLGNKITFGILSSSSASLKANLGATISLTGPQLSPIVFSIASWDKSYPTRGFHQSFIDIHHISPNRANEAGAGLHYQI